MVVLFSLKGLMRLTQMWYYAKLRQIFLKKVRYNLVENLQSLSYSEFLKLDAGKIQNTEGSKSVQQELPAGFN